MGLHQGGAYGGALAHGMRLLGGGHHRVVAAGVEDVRQVATRLGHRQQLLQQLACKRRGGDHNEAVPVLLGGASKRAFALGGKAKCLQGVETHIRFRGR